MFSDEVHFCCDILNHSCVKISPNSPKKRNNASKNAGAANKSARDLARDTAAKQNGARKRAKLYNQGYLLEALNEAMSKRNGAGFTNSGLVFVATNTARSTTEDNGQRYSDPLNLSQKAVQVDKNQYAEKPRFLLVARNSPCETSVPVRWQSKLKST
ncbi:uncharacterized protein LOC134209252 [Armigeres subalbatus]|uniref:uncharacterized protein LOC134209252 n=1 Tax=Armigeres subalbatus TaxID=124917 RepID=UPI002ED4774A